MSNYIQSIQQTIQECKKTYPGQDNKSAVFLKFIDEYNKLNVNIDPNNNQQLLNVIKKQNELIKLLCVLSMAQY